MRSLLQDNWLKAVATAEPTAETNAERMFCAELRKAIESTSGVSGLEFLQTLELKMVKAMRGIMKPTVVRQTVRDCGLLTFWQNFDAMVERVVESN
jgi:hypothetical protein